MHWRKCTARCTARSLYLIRQVYRGNVGFPISDYHKKSDFVWRWAISQAKPDEENVHGEAARSSETARKSLEIYDWRWVWAELAVVGARNHECSRVIRHKGNYDGTSGDASLCNEVSIQWWPREKASWECVLEMSAISRQDSWPSRKQNKRWASGCQDSKHGL